LGGISYISLASVNQKIAEQLFGAGKTATRTKPLLDCGERFGQKAALLLFSSTSLGFEM
jgi:hypothetical protein